MSRDVTKTLHERTGDVDRKVLDNLGRILEIAKHLCKRRKERDDQKAMTNEFN